MPQSFTFPLAGVSGGSAQPGLSSVKPYAYCRQLDPKTGDVVMNGATWQASPTPMLEVVLRVLRTPLGRYVPNVKFGVDYSLVQKALPTTGSAWRAEVIRALKIYVDLGLISQPTVLVDVSSNGLAYEVQFVDLRAKQNVTTGKLAV